MEMDAKFTKDNLPQIHRLWMIQLIDSVNLWQFVKFLW